MTQGPACLIGKARRDPRLRWPCSGRTGRLHPPGMSTKTTICGVVLAGGRGRRMHPDSATGGDKALLPLAGEPLINHVVRRIRPQVSRLDHKRERRSRPFWRPGPARSAGCRCRVADRSRGCSLPWIGPEHAPSSACPPLSVSIDIPFLPVDLVETTARCRARQARRLPSPCPTAVVIR